MKQREFILNQLILLDSVDVHRLDLRFVPFVLPPVPEPALGRLLPTAILLVVDSLVGEDC
ncbi:hypothetical protein DERP_004875 [Dermatophagoides pteronyssinus]|uniref:Uncharacterized protein n=1 Tax=Dermatophagoides pteronyssinus TaxID=6956 RepID=A0ABQ8JSS2_DERPT|nr:hypothetical protein DERP_004875 [Dermatophagoides pteronyssinus]